MKKLNQILSTEQISNFKKDLVKNASFYKSYKVMIESNDDLLFFFYENSAKNIALELFTEKELEKMPLYDERKKTPLCVAIDNVKRIAKKIVKEREEPQASDATEQKASDATEQKASDATEQKASDAIEPKKWKEAVADLQAIRNAWGSYSKEERNAIKLALEMLQREMKK